MHMIYFWDQAYLLMDPRRFQQRCDRQVISKKYDAQELSFHELI